MSILFISSFASLEAQNREDLEEERMKIIQQIDETSAVLQKLGEKKIATLEDLELIQGQIANRQKVIENVTKSLEVSQQNINLQREKKESLQKEYEILVKDYHSLIKLNYHRLLTENKLLNLLSFSNWKRSLQKLRYSRMVERYLQRQINSLEQTSFLLDDAVQIIEMEQQEQKKLLAQEQEFFDELEKDEIIKDEILSKMQGDEMRLKGALIQQKNQRENLNRAIENAILAQLSNSGEEAVNKTSEWELSIEFKNKKGELSWPVDNSIVTSSYGRQRHENLKDVYIHNNGIDIFTANGAKVRSVYKGKVVSIINISGAGKMVIIKHGQYYSVYSGLKDCLAEKGDMVRAGQTIGSLPQSETNLHFEIWDEKKTMDPQKWLR